MDMRKALDAGFILHLRNSENGVVKYTIRNEIGRGGSCLVYDAYYTNNVSEERTVRIKEYYPYKLRLKRHESGELVPDEKDCADFQKGLLAMKEAFRLNNQLFNNLSLTNSVSNTIDIYEANGTVYIVSVYQAGKILSNEDISSLKEAVSIVKAVASTVKKIHDNGYLYLDIKPSNILIYNGVTELVQLFDFNSLIPIQVLNTGTVDNYRISYSNGFAPLEQKTADTKNIGKHTDVYGIGALLFYLIFGHVPNAFDCSPDASYNYELGKFRTFQYQDKLWSELTAFFHESIANYFGDRYKDLSPAINKLEIIARVSDVDEPFLCSTPVISKKHLVGRETELAQVKEYLEENRCIFVTGMGGIGKSSLMRKYVNLHRNEYDSCVYAYYGGSALDLIIDDSQLHVNTVERSPEETREDYYLRKVQKLKRILNNTSSLLIIDNYSGEIDRTFRDILLLGWKVVIISREESPSSEYPEIKVEAIKERKVLYQLFSIYLNRNISDDEYLSLDRIIDHVNGHSLVLELIAKQLIRSHLTIEQVCSLVEEKGFTGIAPEKINYEKDSSTAVDTIHNIILDLFPSDQYGSEYKTILKGLSLFDSPGVHIRTFSEMLSLDSLNVINELIDDRWIETDGDKISLHSVIKEVISIWKWEKEYRKVAICVINYLFNKLKLEGKREEYPAKLLRSMDKINELRNSPNPLMRKYFEMISERAKKSYYTGDVAIQRMDRGSDEQPTDRNLVSQLLTLSEGVLSACRRIDEIAITGEYKNLLNQTVINMPRDREDYILNHSLELLNAGCANDYIKYDLYDNLVTIYDERYDFESAWEIIRKARLGLAFKNNFVKSQYYDLLAQFYDDRLDGAYATDNEYHDRDALLKAIDDSIKYMRRSRKGDSGNKLAQYFISKANTLIRCYPEKKEEIDLVLREAKELCEEHVQKYSSIIRDYNMCRACYFTYVLPCRKRCTENIQKALEIDEKISTSALDTIDSIAVPSANMLLELDSVPDSVNILKSAVTICETDERVDIIPYIRKKLELYTHLLEIYYDIKDIENGKDILEKISRLNDQYGGIGIYYNIPDEVYECFGI